jgi:ABC-type nitrate/sulfonate/bicarbonate transport system substrate-binding protein
MGVIPTRRACLVGAAFLAIARPASAQPSQELSIGLASTSFATVAVRIAAELGFFGKRGITPKFVVLDSASATTTALIAGSINAGVSGPGELVVAQARGQKVIVIANAYRGSSGSLVLSKVVADKLGVSPTAPVTDRLKALDGLVIGAPSATGAYTVSFKGAAKAAGATMRLTYMAQPAMVAALESGAIQGYVGGAPFWALPVVKGSGVLWISGPRGELPPAFSPANTSNLQVMRDFAEANHDLMNRIIAAFADLTKAVDERPAEVKAVVAKLYPTFDAPTLDLLFAAESQAWKTKPPTVEDMAHDVAFVKTSAEQLSGIDSVDPASLFYHG